MLKPALLLLVLIVLTALVVIWSLGSGPSLDDDAPPRSEQAPARVQLYHYWDVSFPSLRDALETQGERYNQSATARLIVTSTPHESYKVNMRAMLNDALGPELYSWWAGQRSRVLVEADLLAPLDGWWQEAHMDAAFNPAVRSMACSYNGRHYLLPLVQCYVGIFYNREIFARHDIEEPQDWPAFLSACRRLRAAGINPIALGTDDRWPAQFWFDYLLLRTAGPAYRKRLLNGQASLSDPELKRVFALWRELIDIQAFNPNPGSSDWIGAAKLMHSHGAAMTLMGTWIMDPYGNLGWQGGVDYGFFPFPQVDADQPAVTLTVVDGLVMARNDADPAAAQAVLAYFADPETQFALAQASGNFAPHVGIDRQRYDPIRQQILAAVSDDLAFAWDLSTPPAQADIGLDMLMSFIADPDAIDSILAEAQAAMVEASSAHD